MKTTKTLGLFAAVATLGLLSTMCSDDPATPTPTTGGTAPTTGGTAATTGGTAPTTGGTAPSTGGTAPSTGGSATGGSATGGTATGGSATGGTAGGTSGGGGTAGVSGGGGKASGGAGGASGGGGGGASGGGGKAGTGGSGGKAGTGGSGGKATGGSGGSGGGATGTFKQVADLLASKCAGCHKSGQMMLINLTNTDNMLYSRLTTVTSGLGKCNGVFLVDKANPSMSILPQAVQMAVNQAGCMINRMPNNCGNDCLSAANIQIITSWVNAGAPEN